MEIAIIEDFCIFDEKFTEPISEELSPVLRNKLLHSIGLSPISNENPTIHNSFYLSEEKQCINTDEYNILLSHFDNVLKNNNEYMNNFDFASLDIIYENTKCEHSNLNLAVYEPSNELSEKPIDQSISFSRRQIPEQTEIDIDAYNILLSYFSPTYKNNNTYMNNFDFTSLETISENQQIDAYNILLSYFSNTYKNDRAYKNNFDFRLLETVSENHQIETNDNTTKIKTKKITVIRRENIKMRNKKRKPIPPAIRKAVWLYYNGKKYESDCYTNCGEKINVFGFECGHVVAHSKGGSIEISNLRPICSNCNRSMDNENMEDFIDYYGLKKINKNDNNICYR